MAGCFADERKSRVGTSLMETAMLAESVSTPRKLFSDE
jgi:hypothetical protein